MTPAAPLRPVILSGPSYRCELVSRRLVPAMQARGMEPLVLDVCELGAAARAGSWEELLTAVTGRLGTDATGHLLVGDGLGAGVAVELTLQGLAAHGGLALLGVPYPRSALHRAVYDEILSRGQSLQVPPQALALMRAGHLFAPARLIDDTLMSQALAALRTVPPEAPDSLEVLELLSGWEPARDRMSQLTLPMLCLCFRNDAVTPPFQGEALAVVAPRGATRSFEGGHGGGVDVPNEVADALYSFAQEVRQ